MCLQNLNAVWGVQGGLPTFLSATKLITENKSLIPNQNHSNSLFGKYKLRSDCKSSCPGVKHRPYLQYDHIVPL